MSSTPIFLMKSWSVRGTETPGRLVELEFETFLTFPLPYPLTFPLTSAWCLRRAIYLQFLSPPFGRTVSLVVHTQQVVVVVVVVDEPMSCALVVVMLEVLGPVKVELLVTVKLELLGAARLEPVAARLQPVAAMLGPVAAML